MDMNIQLLQKAQWSGKRTPPQEQNIVIAYLDFGIPFGNSIPFAQTQQESSSIYTNAWHYSN